MIEPDIELDVRFLSPDEGGRQGPTSDEFLSCILFVAGRSVDVRLILPRRVFPGEQLTMGAKLLDFDNAKDLLKVGAKIELRDYRRFGEGSIVSILAN